MEPFQDISDNQGAYNMSANTDSIIAIRMSSGDGGLHYDTEANTNYNNAHSAGKLIIQYHFAGTANPVDEANFFLQACSPYSEYDCYCLDAEEGQDLAWKSTFMQTIHDSTGCWPLDYMNISTANSIGPVPNCGLWLAAPSWGFNQVITELNSNLVYVAQQGPIVNGVDSDMWFGTLTELQEYGYHAPIVTATTLTTTTTTLPPPTQTTSTSTTTSHTTTTLPPVSHLSWWQKLLRWLHV